MVSPNIKKICSYSHHYSHSLRELLHTCAFWRITTLISRKQNILLLLSSLLSPLLSLLLSWTVLALHMTPAQNDVWLWLWLINPRLTLFASPNCCIAPSAWNKTGTSFYPLINLQSITVWRHRWRHQYTNIWRHIWRHQYIWRHRWRHQYTNIWNIIDSPYFEKSQTN